MQTIVIVGGGAGGLELATQLGRKLGRKNKAKIILVDKNRTHIWKPLLHEVASGTFDASLNAVVYHAHGARHGYHFQLGCLTNVDPIEKTVTLEPVSDEHNLNTRQLKYDQLVLAVGSVSNDFGTPGVKQHCYFLDSHQQAERFHKTLLSTFTRISQSGSKQELHIDIVGAGATGVELAAELFHVTEMLGSYGFEHMAAEQLKIRLIEAGPRILPALPDRIANAAKRELEKIGVEVLEQTRVQRADSDGFVTSEDKKLEADIMIWAAGVKAPEFLANIQGVETNRMGQVLVNKDLTSTFDDNIYVLGDACGFQNPDNTWVPPRAQSAHQMATVVQQNILRKLKGQAALDYQYMDYGSLVNLSRFSTVGSLMGNLTKGSMFIEGRIAKLVYVSLYRMHQMAIHGRLRAGVLWFAERLVKVTRPKMKLH